MGKSLEIANADPSRSSRVISVGPSMRAVLDAAAAGVLVFDADGACLHASAPAAALLGVRRADDLVGTSAPVEIEDDVAAALGKRQETHRPQCSLARRDGTGDSWVECWVKPSGTGVVVTLVDVSARRAEDAQAGFRKLLLMAQSDASLDGILVVSAASEFISYNKRFIEMWGVPKHIVESRSDREALDMVLGKVVDPPRFIAKVQHLYEHPDEESRDEIELRDGRTFDRYSAPVRDNKGTHFGRVWFFRDVTEQRQAEREREEALRRAEAARAHSEEACHAKDEFLAVVSHELRTPLTAVLGWARLLRSRATSAVDRERALVIIERNAVMQVKLIEDLLDVSRVITGKIRLNVAPLELGDILAMVVESVQPAVSAKGIQLMTEIVGSLAFISGDAERLQQVLFNLISNAIKFTPEGGHVWVRLERQGSLTEITVRDDGKGMDPAFLPHVFERFRQADARPTMRAHGGLGLGLAIVRHLVELHGGSVVAESEGKGRGSRFIVRLPVRALTPDEVPLAGPSDRPRAATENSSAREMPNLEGAHVLFVDDDGEARELLAHLLGSCGAHVVTANSVETALAALEAEAFDVIVSDISMPGRDGFDLAACVRESEHARDAGRIPMVALTAMAAESSRDAAMGSGFDTLITKPADPVHVARTVEKALRTQRAQT